LPQPSDAGAQRWLIGGRIQGVGVRPFVCTLANELGLTGTVRNHGGQVEIVASSDSRRTALFLHRMMSEHPAIAQPELVSAETCVPPERDGFRILPSQGGAQAVLLPDQSVCAACLAEMADPGARRYRYPFIACTQCGPRYTPGVID
jgi:hydrogenase maturation protein HypF